MVSSLSPHGQADSSLTSENTAKKTSHDDQSHKTPELKSSAGGRPKGSSKAKKKQDKENKYKCIDSIVFEYSIKHKASKSVEGKVEYGYLKRLIDEKKKEFGINCRISTKSIMNRTHRVHLPYILDLDPILCWKKWSWPSLKFAFRWVKSASPFLAPKPLR